MNGIRPMSLWLKDLSTEEHEKKLAILEPVERIEAKVCIYYGLQPNNKFTFIGFFNLLFIANK